MAATVGLSAAAAPLDEAAGQGEAKGGDLGGDLGPAAICLLEKHAWVASGHGGLIVPGNPSMGDRK